MKGVALKSRLDRFGKKFSPQRRRENISESKISNLRFQKVSRKAKPNRVLQKRILPRIARIVADGKWETAISNAKIAEDAEKTVFQVEMAGENGGFLELALSLSSIAPVH